MKSFLFFFYSLDDTRSNGYNQSLHSGNTRQLSTHGKKPKRQNNNHDKSFLKDYPDKEKTNFNHTNSKEETERVKIPNATSKNRFSNSRDSEKERTYNNIPAYSPNLASGNKQDYSRTQFQRPREPRNKACKFFIQRFL